MEEKLSLTVAAISIITMVRTTDITPFPQRAKSLRTLIIVLLTPIHFTRIISWIMMPLTMADRFTVTTEHKYAATVLFSLNTRALRVSPYTQVITKKESRTGTASYF